MKTQTFSLLLLFAIGGVAAKVSLHYSVARKGRKELEKKKLFGKDIFQVHQNLGTQFYLGKRRGDIIYHYKRRERTNYDLSIESLRG